MHLALEQSGVQWPSVPYAKVFFMGLACQYYFLTLSNLPHYRAANHCGKKANDCGGVPIDNSTPHATCLFDSMTLPIVAATGDGAQLPSACVVLVASTRTARAKQHRCIALEYPRARSRLHGSLIKLCSKQL